MNIEDCRSKVEELAETIKQSLIETSMKKYRSGGIDTEKYGNTCELPKILIASSLKEEYDSFGLTFGMKKEVRNLNKF